MARDRGFLGCHWLSASSNHLLLSSSSILAYCDVKIQSAYAKWLKVTGLQQFSTICANIHQDWILLSNLFILSLHLQLCILLWACVALPEEMPLGVKLSRQPEHSAVSVYQSALSPQKKPFTHTCLASPLYLQLHVSSVRLRLEKRWH